MGFHLNMVCSFKSFMLFSSWQPAAFHSFFILKPSCNTYNQNNLTVIQVIVPCMVIRTAKHFSFQPQFIILLILFELCVHSSEFGKIIFTFLSKSYILKYAENYKQDKIKQHKHNCQGLTFEETG